MLSTPKQLKKIQGEINYLERQYSRMRNLERKEETRRKIQLGGLIKKARLENESTAVLYGLLLDAMEKLQTDAAEKYRAQWKTKGDLAFTHEKQ